MGLSFCLLSTGAPTPGFSLISPVTSVSPGLWCHVKTYVRLRPTQTCSYNRLSLSRPPPRALPSDGSGHCDSKHTKSHLLFSFTLVTNPFCCQEKMTLLSMSPVRAVKINQFNQHVCIKHLPWGGRGRAKPTPSLPLGPPPNSSL